MVSHRRFMAKKYIEKLAFYHFFLQLPFYALPKILSSACFAAGGRTLILFQGF